MAIIFDSANKRIILDSASVSATEIYSRWLDWLVTDDNVKHGLVIRQVGGDDLGEGLVIPPYYFLQGLWRVRPMEASHTLSLIGNLFVEAGGDPVVQTLGSYNVLVKTVVPVQAQAFSSGGNSTVINNTTVGPTADEVWQHPFPAKLLTVAKFLGLK